MMDKGKHDKRRDIAILDPDFHQDPFDRYAWMREHAPVYWDASAKTWDTQGAWGITRYQDIRLVATSSELYASGGGSRADAPPVPSMINKDAPEHLERRALTRRRFTPTAVKRYEDYTREIVIRLIDRALERKHCDVVRDLAMPLPMMVIGRMMDLPEADFEKLLHWSDLIATGIVNMPPDFEQQVYQAAAEFRTYISEWFDKRRESPGDDILSAIVQGKVLGESLGEGDRMHEALLLLVGGDETTRHVITGGLHAMLTHSLGLKQLADDPKLMETAIEEMLRWVTPVKTIARTATARTALDGQTIEAGDKLVLLFESGNRDAAVFDNPEVFDIYRDPNRHLAFGGYGRHHCLGSHLARLEIRVMFEELARRVRSIELNNSAPPRKRFGTFVLGIEQLQVTMN